MKLSIIIPVYNVEIYIEECLNSIIKQIESDNEIEIIVINDGSTDNSEGAIKKFTEENSYIKYYSHPNSGLSYTRNVGLKKAKGDYVWFIDSDDYIDNNAINKILNIIGSVDIIALTTTINNNNYFSIVKRSNLQSGVILPEQLYRKGYVYPYSGVQFHVFNRKFLINHNLNFKEGIYYEDLLFIPKALFLAKTCYYLKDSAYIYRIREGSIINSHLSLKKCNDVLTVADELYLFAQTNNNKRKTNRIIYASIASIAGVYLNNFIKPLKESERKSALQLYFSRSYWISAIFKSFKFKYLIRIIQLYYFYEKKWG